MKKYKLMSGNKGKDCQTNGKDPQTECGCDECDYLMCCSGSLREKECEMCKNSDCPRKQREKAVGDQ